MKKLFKALLVLFICVSTAVTVHAQTKVYVKVRPTTVVVAKPVAPHKTYVWIADEWGVKKGAYVSVPGYWAAPRKGYIWVPGHWATEKRGDYWIPGHWKKI